MSQDGSWQDPEPHPGGEAFVPWDRTRARMNLDEAKVAEHRERLERELREDRPAAALVAEIARLSAELRDARLTIAAIITQHGESLGDGRYRLVVDPAHLETAEARRLSVMEEPNSGVMLIRVRPL